MVEFSLTDVLTLSATDLLIEYVWGGSLFPLFYFCAMCGLEKLGLVDQNWLERSFSDFLPRTLVLGRRQHSESIEVALDNME